jgi:hypothetical protein
MIAKFLKQSSQKPYFLLFALIIVGCTFTCKEFIPELNKNPEAEFCWGRVKKSLQVKFFAKGHPSDKSEFEHFYCEGIFSTDPDGAVVHYKWQFGDGTTGEGENTFHDYEKEGKYFVELTVIDNDDFDDTIIKEVEATEKENILPTAVLSTNSFSKTENINFVWIFDGSESNDPDGEIENYKFEIIRRHSDNVIIAISDSKRDNFVHLFEKADLGGEPSAYFTVTLTVTDDHRGTDYIPIIIKVEIPDDT